VFQDVLYAKIVMFVKDVQQVSLFIKRLVFAHKSVVTEEDLF